MEKMELNGFFLVLLLRRESGKGPTFRRNSHVSGNIIARNGGTINVERNGHGNGHLVLRGSEIGVEARFKFDLRGRVIFVFAHIDVDRGDDDVRVSGALPAAKAEEEEAEENKSAESGEHTNKNQENEEAGADGGNIGPAFREGRERREGPPRSGRG
jgi:hypothetical protein